MTQISASQIITANDLLSGEVVYLTKHGAWARWHADAIIFAHPDRAALCLEKISRSDISVVGPYVANTRSDRGQTPEAVHFREVFRATGPSNRFIGKQASTP